MEAVKSRDWRRPIRWAKLTLLIAIIGVRIDASNIGNHAEIAIQTIAVSLFIAIFSGIASIVYTFFKLDFPSKINYSHGNFYRHVSYAIALVSVILLKTFSFEIGGIYAIISALICYAAYKVMNEVES